MDILAEVILVGDGILLDHGIEFLRPEDEVKAGIQTVPLGSTVHRVTAGTVPYEIPVRTFRNGGGLLFVGHRTLVRHGVRGAVQRVADGRFEVDLIGDLELESGLPGLESVLRIFGKGLPGSIIDSGLRVRNRKSHIDLGGWVDHAIDDLVERLAAHKAHVNVFKPFCIDTCNPNGIQRLVRRELRAFPDEIHAGLLPGGIRDGRPGGERSALGVGEIDPALTHARDGQVAGPVRIQRNGGTRAIVIGSVGIERDREAPAAALIQRKGCGHGDLGARPIGRAGAVLLGVPAVEIVALVYIQRAGRHRYHCAGLDNLVGFASVISLEGDLQGAGANVDRLDGHVLRYGREALIPVVKHEPNNGRGRRRGRGLAVAHILVGSDLDPVFVKELDEVLRLVLRDEGDCAANRSIEVKRGSASIQSPAREVIMLPGEPRREVARRIGGLRACLNDLGGQRRAVIALEGYRVELVTGVRADEDFLRSGGGVIVRRHPVAVISRSRRAK